MLSASGTALVHAAIARAILLIFAPLSTWPPLDPICDCTGPPPPTISVASLTILSVGTLDGAEGPRARPAQSQCRQRDMTGRKEDFIVARFPGPTFVDDHHSESVLLCARIGADGQVRPVRLVRGSGDGAADARAFAMMRGTRFRYMGPTENVGPVSALLLIRILRID